MKNKTLAVLLLLCTAFIPSGFAGEIRGKSDSNYRNIEFIKREPGSENYAIGTLKMLSDKFNELLDLMKKERSNIELDGEQKQTYSKDVKFLTFCCYDTGIRTIPYGRMYVQQFFKGLDDFIYHPMYMLMNPGSGLNFGWLTCSPSSSFKDMLNTFVENIYYSKKLDYFDDVSLCMSHLKKMARLKLEQILKVKNFYYKYPTNSKNAMVVFENIIFIIRRFRMRKDLAVRHLEFVVSYAKSRKNSNELLGKIKEIVTNNIEYFANSVEEMALIYFKII